MISLSVTNPFLIHGEVLKQMQGLKAHDEPVYHMTEDQYCIQMGVRCPGESYPAAAKDMAVWDATNVNGILRNGRTRGCCIKIWYVSVKSKAY